VALVVVTGGARSGKSYAGQQLALSRSIDGVDVLVAVFGRESDPEMADRIAHHRDERPEPFETLEVSDPEEWLEDVEPSSLLVIDCLGTLLGLCMERAWDGAGDRALGDAEADALPDDVAEVVSEAFSSIVDDLVARAGDTIVITNEVGAGLVPSYAAGRLFRDLLGRANRRLVDVADAAYLCVAGRMIDLEALPNQITWPED
jgi:adenosyl cobinamide kinase/adenosyl cobinamide phosphate guanylyltransferase